MKKLLKKVLPEGVILSYHYCVALSAACWYGFPSRKMVIIGITGTKGKTSAANFIWSCLQATGHTTGIVSTANIRVGTKEVLNQYHMTMPGRFTIQKLLRRMADEGCTHCVVETTSEGLKQFRHVGILYDVAVFTNLSPEHLRSHGNSFEKYKSTKGRLFAALSNHTKSVQGKKVEKVVIANTDSEHAPFYLKFPADRHITFGCSKDADYKATDIKETDKGVSFSVDNEKYNLGIRGAFNVYNALPAIALAKLYGGEYNDIAQGLLKLNTIPGRMEEIHEGQPFTVIVDYAHEKQSMTYVMQTAINMRKEGSKVIIVLGAEGGGRDTAKRADMGNIVGANADYVVITNVDPYDDDPQTIINDIKVVVEQAGKIIDHNLFCIEDRREGIRKALSLAGPADIVIITGKGAEQSMIIKGKAIPWDDRKVIREELTLLNGQ